MTNKVMGSVGNSYAAKAVFSRDDYLAGTVRQLDGYGRNGAKPWPFSRLAAVEHCTSWVYRCAMGNAQAAASVPLRLFVRAARDSRGLKAYHPDTGRELAVKTRPVSPRTRRYLHAQQDHRPSGHVVAKAASFGDEFEEVVDSPVLSVLRKANPHVNGFDLLTLAFAMLELTGDAYWSPVMSRALDRPVELWPLLSQWTRIIPRRDGDDDLVAGYEYGATNVVQPVVFEADEVLPFSYPNPRDPFYGLGKVEACWHTLGLFWSEREMQKALFDNNARPDYLLTIDGGTKDPIDEVEAKINAKMRGTRKAGQFLAATGKVSVTPLAWNPKDVGTTENLVEEIAGVFGYPVTKLKANDPNRSNAETGDAGWMKDTILPMLRCMEEALNQNGYLGLFGSGALLDDAVIAFDDPVPANRKMELEESKTRVAMGNRTINEDRRLAGDEPIEGGDVPRVNGQNILLMDELMRAQVEQARRGPEPSPLAGLPALFAPREPVKPEPVDAESIAAQVTRSVSDAMQKRLAEMFAESGKYRPPASESGKMLKLVGDVYVDAEGVKWTVVEERGGEPSTKREPERRAQGDEPGSGGCVESGDGEGHGCGDPVVCAGGEHEEAHGGGDDAGSGPEVAQRGVEPRWVKFVDGAFVTKADADDTVREDEPEAPGDAMMRALRAILADMQSAVLAVVGSTKSGGVRRKLREQDLERIDSELRGFEQRIADELRPIIERVLTIGGTAGLSVVAPSIGFDVTNTEVQRAIESFIEPIKTVIPQTTITDLRRSLGEGISSGETVQQLQQRVRSAGVFDPNRAEQIARSESARAYVQGEIEGWKQSGRVEGKRWLLAPGSCPFCAAAAKAFEDKTVGLEEAFYAKGDTVTAADGKTMKLDYSDVQGPPLHPNCRCDTVAVLKPIGGEA